MTDRGSAQLNDLTGKVVVITGAGQGIGRAYAARFAELGSLVVVADIDGQAAERTAQLVRASGREAVAVTVDVAVEDETRALAKAAVDAFGTVDVLINNAAIFASLKMRPFDEIPLEEWNRVFSVNAAGTFLCSRAVAGIMKERGRGKIINVGSSVVVTGRANYAHYVASKGAVVALTRAMATELGPYNINVNAISPHGIVTEVPRETISEDQWEGILAAQAIKRKGSVADLVGVAVFLASNASDYMTGQTLQVDAGLRYM